MQSAAGPGHLAGTIKTVMPLGPHVVYDVEVAGGGAVKINQSREQAVALLASGQTIHFAPASAAACRIFSAQPS
jgi:hypothetical protein